MMKKPTSHRLKVSINVKKKISQGCFLSEIWCPKWANIKTNTYNSYILYIFIYILRKDKTSCLKRANISNPYTYTFIWFFFLFINKHFYIFFPLQKKWTHCWNLQLVIFASNWDQLKYSPHFYKKISQIINIFTFFLI